jgi:hypothetical protein
MRSRIRRRVVIACVGALVFMALGIYFALARGEGAVGGHLPASAAARTLALL